MADGRSGRASGDLWRCVAGCVVLLLASLVAVGGQTMAADACSLAASGGQFTGVATSKTGGVVTFSVDDVAPRTPGPGASVANIVPGSSVEVVYGDVARYMRTGVRYQVTVFGPRNDGTLSSGIAVAQDRGCGGGGTVYADGRSIDTSIISIAGIHTGGVVVIGVGLAVAVLVGAIVIRRRRYRQMIERAVSASQP
jgi:hypothetical protein